MRKRLEQLDSLRGLAALSVLIYHYLIVLDLFFSNSFSNPQNFAVNLLKYTPLHIVWAGSEAVLFFFVLSGFVLSLKFYSGKRVSYKAFVITRFFRIYPAYYIAVIFGIIFDTMLSRQGISGLSYWFNTVWNLPVTNGLLIDHLFLTRYFGYGQIIPVLWTLVMEIRISLIFPILMILIHKFNWKINLLIGCCLSLAYYLLIYGRADILRVPADYFYTFSFIIMFIIGALLARHRKALVKMIKGLSSGSKILLLVVGVLLYTIRYWLLPLSHNGISSFAADLSISAGVAIFIILSLSTKISLVLKNRLIHFIGKISYSLYLYHVVVLFALVYLFFPKVPIFVLWIAGLFITVFISFLSYKYIEQPAIKIGRTLSRRVSNLAIKQSCIRRSSAKNSSTR